MIGRNNHLIPHFAPFRDPWGQHIIHHETGVIHFGIVVMKPMPHAVQCAGMQYPVIQTKALTQHGQGCKQISVRGRHLVIMTISRHRMKSTVINAAAFGFIVFNVAHRIKRRAVKKFGPKTMGHGPSYQIRFSGL